MGCQSPRNCCCGGCGHKPHDRSLASDAEQPIQWHCCSCVPDGICVTITGSIGTGTAQTQLAQTHLWRYCQAQAPGDDPIVYHGSFYINGTTVTLSFRFSLGPDTGTGTSGRTCSFCVDGTGIPQVCSLIDHSIPYGTGTGTCSNPCRMSTKFCCDFEESFEIDTSSVGDATYATLTVQTARANLLSLTELAGMCGGCNCICRCMCLTVVQTSLLGEVTGGSEASCSDASTVPLYISADAGTGDTNLRVCDGVQYSSVAWTHSLGYTLSLRGREPTTLYSFQLNEGVVVSGVEQDVECPDQTYHVLESGQSGAGTDTTGTGTDVLWIDAEYTFDTNTSVASTSMLWLGYVLDSTDTVMVFMKNWITAGWDRVATISGRDAAGSQVAEWDLDAAHTGSVVGVNEGLVRVRFISNNAATFATDFLRITTNDCCKLYLGVPAGTFSETPAPVDIGVGNLCPNPTARWDLTTISGDSVFVIAGCILCGQTCGGVGSQCCVTPIPVLLYATIIVTGCDSCGVAVVALAYNSVDQSWYGTGLWCGQLVTVTLTCEGSFATPLFRIILETALGCFLGALGYVDSTDVTCDPFEVLFDDFLIGLDCCPNGPPLSSGLATSVVISA